MSCRHGVHRFDRRIASVLDTALLLALIRRRDLAARNLMRTTKGKIKIIDFGLSVEVFLSTVYYVPSSWFAKTKELMQHHTEISGLPWGSHTYCDNLATVSYSRDSWSAFESLPDWSNLSRQLCWTAASDVCVSEFEVVLTLTGLVVWCGVLGALLWLLDALPQRSGSEALARSPRYTLVSQVRSCQRDHRVMIVQVW
jgi:serine/threonine protein kinase